MTWNKLLFLLVTKFMRQDQHQQTRTLEASHIVHAQLLQLGKMLLLLVENRETALGHLGVTDLSKNTPPTEELDRAS